MIYWFDKMLLMEENPLQGRKMNVSENDKYNYIIKYVGHMP